MMRDAVIAGSVIDDRQIVNLAEFGEDADLPHACLPIAGLQYYDYDKIDDMIGRVRPQRGDRLELQRQPDNPFDRNAVQIRWRNGRLHLGYLPRRVAQDIAPLLDGGATIRCYAINAGNGTGWSAWALLVSERLSQDMPATPSGR